jgi:gamma-glutamyltranspeptidase/glutathione hydrolase
MNRGHGLISVKDLRSYRSVWRKPLEGEYRGYRIITAPPPSGGGILLLQMLSMIEKYEVNESGFHSAATLHIMIEAERRAFADRSFFAGDPDFVPVPVERLISKGYLMDRMSTFRANKASLSSDIQHGFPEKQTSEETTHYSVTDREGNAVSTTTTLNGSFGNCIFVEGAGFLLNNEMDDFSVKPGFPNMYGLTGGEANAIEPGKRMLSSMTPSIVLKDGKLFMVTGSPGGSTIPTTVFQVVVNAVDFGMNIQESVDAGRFHHQWMPDLVYVENNSLDSITSKKIEAMGHCLRTRSYIGSVNAIMELGDGSFQGGADRRGNNSAASY